MLDSGFYENSHGMTADNVAAIVAGLPRAGTTFVWQIVNSLLTTGVVKTHHYLNVSHVPVVLIRRDPRDCAVSHWRWQKNRARPMDLEEMVYWTAYYDKYIRHFRQYLDSAPHEECWQLRYEDYWQRMDVLFDILESALKLEISDEKRAELSLRHGMEANRAVAAKQDAGHDPKTLIHRDHVHEGLPGTWRTWVSDAAVFNSLMQAHTTILGYSV